MMFVSCKPVAGSLRQTVPVSLTRWNGARPFPTAGLCHSERQRRILTAMGQDPSFLRMTGMPLVGRNETAGKCGLAGDVSRAHSDKPNTYTSILCNS